MRGPSSHMTWNDPEVYSTETIPHQDTHCSQHASRLLECAAAAEEPNERHDYAARHQDVTYDVESVDF